MRNKLFISILKIKKFKWEVTFWISVWIADTPFETNKAHLEGDPLIHDKPTWESEHNTVSDIKRWS